MLRTGEPDFGFCLGWANQPWTDTWLGTGRVLMAQQYSHEDDVAHARWCLDAFADPRYLRVDGRPVFVMFRPGDLPEPRRTADTFRDEATRAGLQEPLLLGIDAHALGQDFRDDGFDGTVAFEPSLGLLPHNSAPTTLTRPYRKVARTMRNLRSGAWSTSAKVYDYRLLRRLSKRQRLDAPPSTYPTIFVGWDNTPRRGLGAIVIVGDTVEAFEEWLAELVLDAGDRRPEERLVFVNAWNEWAEGNHLEPDLDDGLAKLEAVRRVVSP